MKIVITGHRPKKMGNIYDIYNELYLRIGRDFRNILIRCVNENNEKIQVIVGMALGIDTICALVVLKLKKQYLDKFELICLIPCKNQERKWSYSDQKRYSEILKNADSVSYVEHTEYASYKTMYKRDECMIDLMTNKTDFVYAIWNGVKEGGTYHTIKYAKKNNKKILIRNLNMFIY